MLKKITRLCLPILCMIGASGCTTTPTATRADIPLVHSSLAYSLTPDRELAINIPNANLAHDTQDSISVHFNGHQYDAVKHYVSATGNKCIRFLLASHDTMSTDTNEKLTTCQRDGQWRVVAPLVASSSVESE
ncbi:hypothetical protein [Alteromonas sp. D210916BOD_24]|uniref:hypothetical protein n=1 Tax=Alteromonas sp. D210916BOD_24 TaxID=3157618 RepID=UPI00399C8555